MYHSSILKLAIFGPLSIHPTSNPLTPFCNFTCSDTSTRGQWQLCNFCHPAQLSSQPWYPELSVCSLWTGAQCKGQWTQVCNFLLFILFYVLVYWSRDYTFKQVHDSRLLTNTKKWHKPIKTVTYEVLLIPAIGTLLIACTSVAKNNSCWYWY